MAGGGTLLARAREAQGGKLTAGTLLRGACHAVLLSGALMRPGAGYALPSGGVVSSGTANIATVANTTTITQSTNKAIIDWTSFNVNSGEHVNFVQPGSSSITLNRIHDANPSVIDGEITANGKVWLVNSNGVFFGSGAQINVAGLVATTADIDNTNFENGNYTFNHSGNPNATIQNDGSITVAQAGLAAFVAPNVVNNGTITARLGKVALASGDTFALDMYGDGLMSVAVSNAVAQQLVQNSGHISATGGQVQLTAAAASNIVSLLVNNSGIIEANAAGVGESGEIRLYAAGHGGTSVAQNSGTLSASGYGAGETGGTVQVLADNVTLMSGSTIDVSGDAGGGTVHVGGDFHGGGSTPTAQHTAVETGATILANATTAGNGGQVAVWADDETDFGGHISARGGSASGDGGYVETSGHTLYAYGTVDAGTTNGAAGSWLLDPYNVTVAAGAGVDTNINCVAGVCTPTNNATIYANNISATLSGGTAVTITTGAGGASTGDITVNTATSITSSFAGTTSLTLSAYHNITFTGTAGISTTNGKLNLILDAATGGNSGFIQINTGTINTHGGDVYMGGGALDGSGRPTGAAWGNGAGNSRFGINLNGTTLNAAGGSINLNGAGWTGGVNTASSHGVLLQGLAVVETTGSGNITITGQGGGSGIGNSSHGIYLADTAGTTAISAGSGTITLIGTGGVTGGSGNYGINDTGSVITGSGSIILDGTGGIGAGSLGIMFNLSVAGEAIQSTSGASVLLKSPGAIELSKANIDSTNATPFKVVLDANDANGGSGYVELTGSTINSSGGNIYLAGGALDGSGNPTGAAYGNSDFRYGVYFSGLLLNAAGGNIHMNGVGWSGGVNTSNAYGVNMPGSGVIETSGAGTITITGQGGGNGTGVSNFGINIAGGTIQTATGAITLTGTTGNGTISNIGIYMSGGLIAPTGAASIILNGTGSAGAGNYGVDLTPSIINTTLIQSASGGEVLLESPGDIRLANVVINSSTGTAFKFVVDANDVNGGTSGDILFSGSGSTISTSGGNIYLAGGPLDGSGNPTGFAYGDINNAYGVQIRSTTLDAGGGDIHIAGVGYNDGINGNDGVYLGGSSNTGVTVTTSGAGAITITGVASNAAGYGIATDTTGYTIGGAADSGNITLAADTLSLGSGTVVETSGNITFKPYTTSASVGVMGGAGTVQFDSSLLGYLSGESSLTFGGTADTGLMTLGAYSGWNLPVSFVSGGGGSILVSGNQTATGSGSFSFTGPTTLAANLTTANQNITFNSAVTMGGNSTLTSGSGTITFGSTVNGDYDLTASAGAFSFGGAWGGVTALDDVSLTSENALTLPSITAHSILARTTGAAADLTLAVGKVLTADDVTLVAGRNFVNNAGAGAIAASDRWLVYSTNPAADTDGGLVNDFVRYSCTFGGSCPSFSDEHGNGFLYSYTPTLTITPLDMTLAVGGGPTPHFGYTIAGYLNVTDQNADSISGNLGTNYTQTSPKGDYRIGASGSTLYDKLGYGFVYGADATLTLLNGPLPTNIVYAHHNDFQKPEEENGCSVQGANMGPAKNCGTGMAYFMHYLTDELFTNP